MAYQDPGYNVFDWRSQEGGLSAKQGLQELNQHHDQWQQQQAAAAEQRRQQELTDAAERANQYNTATQGAKPSAFEPAPEPDPKSMYQTGYDPTSSFTY